MSDSEKNKYIYIAIAVASLLLILFFVYVWWKYYTRCSRLVDKNNFPLFTDLEDAAEEACERNKNLGKNTFLWWLR